MSVLHKIENAAQRFILKAVSTPTIYNALQQKLGESVTVKIVPRSNPRSREDITTYLASVKMAEHPETPSRIKLYNMYDVIKIDNHIESLIGSRTLKVQGSKFKVVDQNWKTDDKATALLQTEWFFELVEYAMESIWNGHSLIQFNEIIEKQFDSVDLVPRKHVRPEFGEYLINESDQKGIPYRGTSIMDWCIEVGKPRNLGLFMKAAPGALWKKSSFAQWSQYNELFGIPFRWAKTSGRNVQRLSILEDIMQNSGSAGWAVLSEDEDMQILQNGGGDAQKVFDAFIGRINSELSKLFLHQTMTSDNGSSRSQAEVHADVAKDVHNADKTFIAFTINRKVFPLLIKHGYPLKGRLFEWDESTTLPIEDRIKVDAQILTHYDVDPSYIEETYNVPVLGLKNKSQQEIENELAKGADMKLNGKKKVYTIAMAADLDQLYNSRCQVCGGHNVTNAFAGKDEAKIQQLLEDMAKVLYEGTNVPEETQNLYFAYADLLKKGVKEGFGADLSTVDYTTPNAAMIAALQENVHVFSGAKSLTVMRELRSLLTNSEGNLKGWSEFKNDVLAVHDKYNVTHLRAEYQHAVAASQMAAQWQSYVDDEESFPNLKYRTAGDSRVRPAHQQLDGTIAPLNSDFWDLYYPPNDWRCRCDVEQAGIGDEVLTNNQATAKAKGLKMHRMFKGNVGKTGTVFPKDHPQLKDEDYNKWDAQETYGMPDVLTMMDRVPANRAPQTFSSETTWEFDFNQLLQKAKVGESNPPAIKGAIETVNFQTGFIKHMKEDKQFVKEKRWELVPEAVITLQKPDEVWRTNFKGKVNTAYIRYHNDFATVIVTNSVAGKPEVFAKTFYVSVPGTNQYKLYNTRKGILMYRK